MPRKRTNNTSSNKQKNPIATRLIQISLIMDDYVYKHKEIPEYDASSYILEISSLKNKCNDDPRSLQVIEKLTRCMKTVVNDHRKKREKLYYNLSNKKVTAKANYGRTISSTTNFDTKHFTEENNAVSMKVIESSDVIDLNKEDNNKSHQITYNTTNNNVENKPSSDLIQVYSEDKDSFSPPSNDNPKNILNNDKLNLSQDLFYPHTQDENHVNGIDNAQDTPLTDLTDENQHLQNSYAKTSSYTQMDYSQSILSVNSFVGNGDSLNLQKQLENTPASQTTIENTENYIVANLLPKDKVDYPNINNLTEKEQQQLVNSTTHKISDLQLDHFDNPLKSVFYSATNIYKGKDETTKAKKAPRKKKVNMNSQESVKSKDIQCKPRKKKNLSKAKKDKVNIVKNINSSIHESPIDLSWIEDMRYVREISDAENHTRTKDLSNNFWENYSLPIDWDDSEFEYNFMSSAGT